MTPASSYDDYFRGIDSVFHGLNQGLCPSVKYFSSPKSGQMRDVKMPRIIVGASPESLDRLIEYSEEIMNGSKVSDKLKIEMKNDPFRFVFFGEVMAQLDLYANRLRKVVEAASRQKKYDIEKSAREALGIYETSLKNFATIAAVGGVTNELIRKHIRGDHYAQKMAQELSVHSQNDRLSF